MFSRLIHYISLAAVALITVSFGLFAADEAKLAANGKQVQLSAGGADNVTVVVARDEHGRQLGHGATRARIDTYADKITGPFESAFNSKDPWTMRLSALFLGLAFWGLVLQWLARSLGIWTSGSSSRPATTPTY